MIVKRGRTKNHPHIIAKIPQGYHKIYLSEIECLEAQNKKAIFHLCSGKVQEALGTFSNYAKPLTIENGFFKCHRSYIVSIPQVDHFNTAQIRTRSGMPGAYRSRIRERIQRSIFRIHVSKGDHK